MITDLSTLQDLLEDHDLEDAEETIRAAARHGIRLHAKSAKSADQGKSHLGGVPEVPEGFVWPTKEDRPLGFIAQIDCEQVAAHDADGLLPKTGRLYFFYDMEEQPWGFDPADRGGAVVIYAAQGPWEKAEVPEELEDLSEPPLKKVPLGAAPGLSIPDPSANPFFAMKLSEDDVDRYRDMVSEVQDENEGGTSHQLLGHSDNIQCNMELECQLVSNGVYCGDATGYQSKEGKALAKHAGDWRLLLQVDSDEDAEVMWGDSGRLYFWIREVDLRARKFETVWAVLQCF